jgi:hypothetical protein
MKLTPCKFDAQYHDGLLELPGKKFEWNGIAFVVHKKRLAYRFPGDTLCVSAAETGFGCGRINETRSFEKAALEAVAKFEAIGVEKVKEAIEKSRSMKRSSVRLSA